MSIKLYCKLWSEELDLYILYPKFYCMSGSGKLQELQIMPPDYLMSFILICVWWRTMYIIKIINKHLYV